MNIKKGLKLLEEREGTGAAAQPGYQATYNMRAYLSKGDEIPINDYQYCTQGAPWPPDMFTRDDRGTLINFHCTIGKRNAFAAIEYSLAGMKVGGYRKVKAKPHLAYREGGVDGVIPKNAVITFEIWLRKLQCPD